MDWEAATKLILKAAQYAPRKVYGYVKLGYACNNNCLFCTAEWKKRHGDRNTRTVMNEVERIIHEDQVCTMVYSGGEPTVRSDLLEILRHAKSLGIDEQNIQTNGRKLSDMRYLEDLRNAGLTSCFVSIHGPVPGVHDWLTRSPGAFDQTCTGLANLDGLRMPLVTNTVICKQNYRLLGELVTYLGRKFQSICTIKLSYPRLQGGAADNLSQIIVPLWEAAPFVLDAIDRGAEAGVYVETEFVPFCLLGKRFDRTDNFSTTRVNLSDLAYTNSNYCRQPGQVFYEACGQCDVRNRCSGIDTLHHEAFGEGSFFRPVSLADMMQ